MDDLKLNYENTPDPIDLEFLDSKISEYCFSEIGQYNYKKLALFFRDRSRNIVAGLYGHTGLGWLYIDVLWVEKNYRSNGLGTRLMEAAEYEAIRRECHDAYLYTYSFQNPNFYERLGYYIFDQLNNFPDEHTKYFMTA